MPSLRQPPILADEQGPRLKASTSRTCSSATSSRCRGTEVAKTAALYGAIGIFHYHLPKEVPGHLPRHRRGRGTGALGTASGTFSSTPRSDSS
jgi:hypothetical protein